MHLPGLLLVMTLAISLLLFLLLPPQRVRRTLFFPGTTELTLRSESRLMPRVERTEDQIRLLVEDLILGPADIDNGRLFPRTTDLQSIILLDGTAYVDLSLNAIDGDRAVRISVEEAAEAIRRTIRYNIRSIDSVVITIGGQIPFSPAFRERTIGN